MFEVDPIGLLAREQLAGRVRELVAETCAWSVGLSDQPFHLRRHGRVVPSGVTLGMRAVRGQHLGGDEDARLELAEATAGSFQDALNALTADGRVQAERFEDEVLVPFVLDTCVRAAERAAQVLPTQWAELLDELGEDGSDLVAVVRAAEWEAPLRTDAEHLVLAALGHVPLVEVEAEGLPLSLVRAAEAELRAAASEPPRPLPDEDLAGALFLAEVAVQAAGLGVPVPPDRAADLLTALLSQGLEPEEVLAVLSHLPVLSDTVDAVAERLAQAS